jgi:hypothetical protein
MASTQDPESQQQDSDAENEHLMSRHEEEKVLNFPRSYIFHKRRIQFTHLGLTTLLISTAFMSVLLSGLGLHFLHLLTPQTSTQHTLSGQEFGSCGRTPTSARQANCTFDVMSFSWLPSSCSDPELTSEFVALRNWTWWVDKDQIESVPFEEVQKGGRDMLFVNREYHMYHCTYMWKKLHRGMEKGVVDSYIGSYEHTGHCEMMLLGMEGKPVPNRNVTDTAILMKFPRCQWV